MAEEITRLKAGDGKPILAHGGAGFMRSLLATGLVDELRLPIHPVALGKGLPIFTGRHDLKLVEATALSGWRRRPCLPPALARLVWRLHHRRPS
ncbi:MAG: dihydrofolate reductase family protein [Asticcacaulis sp.]